MTKGRVMTARAFAREMKIDYATAMRWLKRGIVPGAVKHSAPDRGVWWVIPESALKMERPRPGRKPTHKSA